LSVALTPGAAPSRVDRRAWIAPGVAAGAILLTALLYWPSTRSLLREWLETEASAYNHGSLVFLLVLWLAIRALRGRTPDAGARRAWPLLLLAGASFVWLIAFRSGIQVAHQALLPVIIALMLWALLGMRVARHAAVPVALLYSAVPVWHVLVPALQAMTVAVVGVLLRITGITAYVLDDFVYIRSGTFHIEDGCAGLHYFIVGATIALVYGELRGDRWRVRIGLLMLGVAFSLVGNWLRVYTIIVIGELSNMQNYLVRVEHGNFGWLLFLVMMVAFVLVARTWALEGATSGGDTAAGGGDEVAIPRIAAPTAVLAIAAAAIGPAWLVSMPLRAATAPNVAIADHLEGWEGPRESCEGRWRPKYLEADLESQREYTRGGQAVCAYLATYLLQRQDKELIGYLNQPYARNAEVVSSRVRSAAGHTVNEVQIGGDAHSDRIIWYAYRIGDREVRRGVEAQLAYSLGTLKGAPASSVYAISANCLPDCASARRLLEDFLPHIRGSVGENGT
jgi:EpsI family protein